ncbi:hypothetical protein [Umezawaea sp. NPDC059074]|uniref:hypothetical protein n=1 Tax=Umezawaea sp. NPDC059074 TaxID=3346716 RepID=UPI003681D01B
MTATTRRGGLDWSAKHTITTGTLNITGGVLAGGMVGSLFDLPPVYAAAGAGVGAVAHAVTAAGTGRAGVLARVAGWAGGGGWMVWALETSPWNPLCMATLAALGVAGGVTASVLRATDTKTTQLRAGVAKVVARQRTADEWEDRIARVCGITGVTTAGVEAWEEGTGFTLDLNLPAGGHTWRDLVKHQAGLASDADLPNGCGVEVLQGSSRRTALLRVSTVDAFQLDRAYPEDWSPLSILNPVPLGQHRDSSVAGLSLREDTCLLTGQKGGGKTNELQVINAGLVRCVDNLVWHIDLNGGGMALPWIQPWHERGPDGGVPVPAVDWVASTAGEATRMCEAALRIAKGRKVAYQALCRQAGTDKLPVSPEVPQITIVVDECAEIMGDGTKYPKLRDMLEEIQRIARAMAVNLVFCGLSATTDVIGSTAVRKQSRARISMRVSDAEELNYLFGWNCKALPEDMPYPGCGLYLQDTTGQPVGFKGYRLVGQALEAGAVEVAGLRPELDQVSADFAGTDYATRWDRADHLFLATPDTDDEDQVPAAVPSAPRFDPAALAAGHDAFVPRQHTPNEVEAPEFNPADPHTWPAIDVSGLVVPAGGVAVAVALPDLVRQVLDAMDAAGGERMHSAALARAIGTTQDTLGTLLPQVGLKALPNSFWVGPDRSRGYARADVESVAERIQSGEIAVPHDVANWTPNPTT